VVRVRTGIVQSPAGGTLRLFRRFLRRARADSQRPTVAVWIGIDDLVDVYHRGLWDTDLSGAVNAFAPEPPQRRLHRTLAHVLHRPALLPVTAVRARFYSASRVRGTRVPINGAAGAVAAGDHDSAALTSQTLRHLLGADRKGSTEAQLSGDANAAGRVHGRM